MRAQIALTVVALVACSPSPTVESDPTEERFQADEPGTTRLTLEELPPMPGYPDAQDGKLVAISDDGAFSINKAWEAEAGFCDGGVLLEFYAVDDSSGTVIVLQHPDSDVIGEYAVALADSVNPEERAARIGVQVLEEGEASGLQAIVGSLEVTEAGDRISGRFTSTIRELNSGMLTRYVGVFSNVRLKVLSEDYCRQLYPEQEPQTDPDSTTSRDSVSGLD
jgi:hypothetical protein